MSSAFREDIAAGSGKPQTVLQGVTLQSDLRSSGHSSAKAPARISLAELVEEFQSAINEKDELGSRLSAALEEIATVTRRSEQARAEFESERLRMSGEIENLRRQLAQSSRTGTNTSDDVRGLKSVLAAREKVIRDEFERKFLELTVEVRQERNKYAQVVEKMKSRLSSCICQALEMD